MKKFFKKLNIVKFVSLKFLSVALLIAAFPLFLIVSTISSIKVRKIVKKFEK